MNEFKKESDYPGFEFCYYCNFFRGDAECNNCNYYYEEDGE